jgi:hypothetical protein
VTVAVAGLDVTGELAEVCVTVDGATETDNGETPARRTICIALMTRPAPI